VYLSNDQRVVLSPTDLADFLACRHKTALELEAARGERERPTHSDPFTDLLRKRGEEHERRYVDSLRAQGLTVEDLSVLRSVGDRAEKAAQTLEAMRRGPDVIVQAPLFDGTWFGYADILLKVPGESALGDWHYEAQDTKLARETRAGAILQLCVYTDLLTAMQRREPERFVVVTPAGSHAYRVTDVAAYFRLVKCNLRTHVGQGFSPADHGAAEAAPHDNPPTVPDPVEHCSLCRWWDICNAQRRAADHLQFVANLGRRHKKELEAHGITTKAALAAWDVPPRFKPSHGARETYVRLQEQAALQVRQADTGTPVYTLLHVEPHVAPDGTPLGLRGLKRLPEPSPGDLYLDLEGDPFARNAFGAEAGEGAREYLFGLGRIDADGRFHFRGWWAFDDASERQAFEEVMDEIAKAIEAHPGAHVYHYAAYEQTAFKRLAGRYATRAEQLDELLRGGRLVDLYAIVRESVRAGVESYSIKELEPFYAFTRDIDLRKAGQERQAIEIALESGAIDAITPEIRDAVEGYNRDDVRSTWELHKWLEARRDEAIARGDDVPRPVAKEGEAPEKLGEREQRVEELRARLLATLGDGPVDPRAPAHLVAYLLDWHRRENKAEWWEYFRLVGLSDDDLLDERKAVSGLRFVESKPFISEKTGKPTKSTIDRYTFPPQDCDVREGQKLNLTDAKQWGEVVAIDRQRGLLDVKVGPSRAGQRPTAAFAHEVNGAPKIEDALYQIGCDLADGTASPLARALLNAALPSVRDVRQLRDGVLAIQGPPGTGKTYSGGVMICDLVSAGKSVGVTALSHAAIANLLKAVRKEATRRGIEVPIRHVRPEEDENAFTDENPKVVGGTAWYWTSNVGQGVNVGQGFSPAIDVLFVDEAGQMSLANTLACTVAANALVLLGDPQQLEQPTKGVHPDGVGGSALQHYLAGHRTMPAERGEFLDTTRRLAPSICAFTSEAFYEGRLKPLDGLGRQVLTGSSRFSGAGLRVVPVPHDGNRNASDEEVTAVLRIVDDLLELGSQWIDEHGVAKQITAADILIVAPYNAQVTRIEEALARHVGQGFSPADVAVGTVDRFQGQEAPVVIYSMATSRPEDAPRGLGFLYSLNRFNVATSRARCMCIVVASPALFAPDCQSPPQMLLANALCRYVELASREQGIIEA
jgi:uncharacterized protein